MAIKKIRVTNFKSFKDLEVELGHLNILIGANASGKSNFIQIFKFLRDIEDSVLKNAISMQGGVEYLRNIGIGVSEPLLLEVTSDRQTGFRAEVEKKYVDIEANETIYKFIIEFEKEGSGIKKIVEDKLIHKCSFYGKEREELGSGEIIISIIDGKLNIILPDGLPINKSYILPPYLKDLKLPSGTLLLETPFSRMHIWPEYKAFGDISIYDFDPKLPKKATPIAGKADLEEDASNLAIALENILEDKERKRKFSNLLTYLLPFVDDLDVKRFADKSSLFMCEKYFEKQYLPASLLSDGTINITALIIALFFSQKALTIIEEPERNIHPHLISRVVSMMKDASRDKQIIVTTHNPEMIKHAEPKDILLVSRDKEGFSSVSRPSEKEEVKIFLENEMGIDDLYVDNLLEI